MSLSLRTANLDEAASRRLPTPRSSSRLEGRVCLHCCFSGATKLAKSEEEWSSRGGGVSVHIREGSNKNAIQKVMTKCQIPPHSLEQIQVVVIIFKGIPQRFNNKKQLLGCPWKLVTIVSKLVYNLLKGLITYSYIGVITQLLSTMDIPVREYPDSCHESFSRHENFKPSSRTFGKVCKAHLWRGWWFPIPKLACVGKNWSASIWQ